METLNLTLNNNLKNFLNHFSDDATCWSEATDEIRECAKMIRESHSEFVGEIEALNFRFIPTPAEWNKRAKNFIVKYWPELPVQQKKEIDDFISNFNF